MAVKAIIFLLLAALAAEAVKLSPDLPPQSVEYNATGNAVAVREIPLGYTSEDGAFTNVKTAPGCAPEQVSLQYFGTDILGRISILVSWTTCDPVVETPPDKGDCAVTAAAGTVTGPQSTNGLQSIIYYTTSTTYPKTYRIPVLGKASSYVYDYSSTGGLKYASPIIHHALITGLIPGIVINFMIADTVAAPGKARLMPHGRSGPNPYTGSFTVPGRLWSAPSPFPFRVAVIGDPGETYESEKTLRNVMKFNPDMLFIMGDLTYADEPDLVAPPSCNVEGSGTYPYRWDTFGRFYQPVLSKVAFMSAVGNHELEVLPEEAKPYAYNFQSRQLAFNNRYPQPQLGATTYPKTDFVTPQPNAPTSETSGGSTSPGAYANSYFKSIIRGVATTIWLSSYSPYDVNGFFAPNEQIEWLKATLAAVDRKATPWLVVGIHSPLYNSYVSHFKENECFRAAIEPLLRQYSVDLVLAGHVHAYERMKTVYDYKVDNSGCAPMHVTVGDGGNIEDAAKVFITSNATSKYISCATPESPPELPTYQPTLCVKYNEGEGSGCLGTEPCYCYAEQPSWSAYREPSFGHGRLVFNSATSASWQWVRNGPDGGEVSDEVTVTRDPACAPRPVTAKTTVGAKKKQKNKKAKKKQGN